MYGCADIMTERTLTVVIPALNEEEGIAHTINAIPRAEIEKAGYGTQVLVVDNGSRDRTAELAAKEGADVVPEPRPGYGSALKRGFCSASGQVVVTVDADATYPVDAIPRLLELLDRQGLDFLTTNRFAELDDGAMPFQNRLGNKLLALETRLLFGLRMRDPESGMWMFRRSILDRLQLHSDSWPLSHEIKIEACYYAGCRWQEAPIRYSRRLGRTKLLNGWKVGVLDMLHIAKKRAVR